MLPFLWYFCTYPIVLSTKWYKIHKCTKNKTTYSIDIHINAHRNLLLQKQKTRYASISGKRKKLEAATRLREWEKKKQNIVQPKFPIIHPVTTCASNYYCLKDSGAWYSQWATLTHTHMHTHTHTHTHSGNVCIQQIIKIYTKKHQQFFLKPACVTKHWLTPLFPKESLECHAGSTIPLTPTELHRPASLYIFLKHKLPRLSLQHSLLGENWLVRIQGRMEGTRGQQSFKLISWVHTEQRWQNCLLVLYCYCMRWIFWSIYLLTAAGQGNVLCTSYAEKYWVWTNKSYSRPHPNKKTKQKNLCMVKIMRS